MFSNLEKWNYYLKDRPSPQSWIDLGWLFVVSSALQRRVWYDSLEHAPLFLNLYAVLIGPPGLGKNLVISPVTRALKHWAKNPSDQNMEEDITVERKQLIATGPDNITPECLIEDISKATRRFTYADANNKQQIYTHASMAFSIEELNSLFKRNKEDVPKFFLKGYDCGDYDYRTKHNGKDLIRKMCVSLLAGATIEMLLEAQHYHIFESGFTSRTLFAFEFEPRNYNFSIGEISQEQELAFAELLEWVRKLTGVFGQLTVSKEANEYLEEWHKREHVPIWLSASAKMQHYFSRKRALVKKLAGCIHYSENLDNEVTLKDFQKAISFLAPIEKNMAMGITAVGKNELHPVAREIKGYLKQNPGRTLTELMSVFMSEVNHEELEVILKTLKMAGEVREDPNNKYYAK